MPAITWSQANTTLAPLPAWRFYTTFPAAVTNAQTLSIEVARISLPIQSLDTESVPYGAGVRNFPSVRNIEALTVTFMEDVSLTVIKSFIKWNLMVIDTNSNYGLPSAYWQAISFEPINNDGSSISTVTYNHAWPTHITGLDWDGSMTGHITPTVTFAVDVQNNMFGTNITG